MGSQGTQGRGAKPFSGDGTGGGQGLSQHIGWVVWRKGGGEIRAELGERRIMGDGGGGVRSQSLASIVRGGMGGQVFVDATGEFKVSAAEQVLANL